MSLNGWSEDEDQNQDPWPPGLDNIEISRQVRN